jgi:hypothetical protein
MAINLNNAGSGAEHPDDGLLEDARMAASSDWEESFVADLLDRRQRHGANFSLSARERNKLYEISGE